MMGKFYSGHNMKNEGMIIYQYNMSIFIDEHRAYIIDNDIK